MFKTRPSGAGGGVLGGEECTFVEGGHAGAAVLGGWRRHCVCSGVMKGLR